MFTQPRSCRAVTLACLLLIAPETALSKDLTDLEFKQALAFSLRSLPPLPPSPGNRYADHTKAIELGKELFFDTRLSANGKVSCANCHQPDRQFQDDLTLGRGVSEGKRRTMPLRGVQWSPWQFWDGRKDSVWSQALAPLEDRAEHNVSRVFVVKHVLKHYPKEYQAIFAAKPLAIEKLPEQASPLWPGSHQETWNALPINLQDQVNRVFANTGKAIAAFIRTLKPEENLFDLYLKKRLKGDSTQGLLSEQASAGYRLFTGKGRCSTCHRGPRFTDDDFHKTGVSGAAGQPPDLGRLTGASKVLADPFNCQGKYSDANPDQCPELQYLQVNFQAILGAFKTPSLRGVSRRSPYMHAGQIASLEGVIDHYTSAPDRLTSVGTGEKNTELKPLKLSQEEKKQLIAFLRML